MGLLSSDKQIERFKGSVRGIISLFKFRVVVPIIMKKGPTVPISTYLELCELETYSPIKRCNELCAF